MDRRTLLAMAVCIAIFAAWQKLYLEPYQKSHSAPPSVLVSNPETPAASAPKPSEPPSLAPPKLSSAPAKPRMTGARQTETLSTGKGVATLQDQGPLFSGWVLDQYKVAGTSQNIDLESVTLSPSQVVFAFDRPELEYLSRVQGTFEKTPEGLRWRFEDQNVSLTRMFTLEPSTGVVQVRMDAKFHSAAPGFAFVSVRQKTPEDSQKAHDHRLVYFTQNSIERAVPKDVSEVKSISTPIDYIGVEDRYFLLTLLPIATPAQPEAKALLQPLGDKAAQISLVYPVGKSDFSASVRAVLTPKELDTLRSINPKLDHVVDFGWFTIVAYPLLKMLHFFYGLFKNYGIAVILLTVVIKLLLYPLTYKSAKSMRHMAKVQPQIQKLRDKYKDDKETLNREMLTLMRTNGYNPAAGCLPILLQMPIFFALYRVLYGSIELYGAPFALWIHDLSAHDPWFVTPVLLTVTMFLQQKLTPSTSMDPAQQKMLQFMPVIFGAFMVMLPSGLTLYMLVNAIMSILQQLVLNKKLDAQYGRPSPAATT